MLDKCLKHLEERKEEMNRQTVGRTYKKNEDSTGHRTSFLLNFLSIFDEVFRIDFQCQEWHSAVVVLIFTKLEWKSLS
jgi:hypothetical protein